MLDSLGKYARDWWSTDVVPGIAVHDMKRNNPLPYRLHLRFGVRYMLIEAGWHITVGGDTGGHGAGITRSISEIHLPQLIEYARLRNIGVWIGVDRKPLDAQMDKAPL